MYNQQTRILISGLLWTACLCWQPQTVLADDVEGLDYQLEAPVALPPGGVYRYKNAEGRTVMVTILPREGILAGYEVLDNNGRLVQTVAPAPTREDFARLNAERQAETAARVAKQQDKELLRLYAAPEDAERARDRQIHALRLNIDFARGNISQLQNQLDQEVAVAAGHEKTGRKIPTGVEEAINRYSRQIEDLEQDITQYREDIEHIQEEFKPIIERLHEIAASRQRR